MEVPENPSAGGPIGRVRRVAAGAGMASFARLATRYGEGKQCEKNEERDLRTELRPSLRLTEPGGEESEPQNEKDDAKRNPHDQPRELLILQGIETRSG